MKKSIFFILSILLTTTLITQPVLGYWGARPMGMGGAFTAIADDPNAPLWNPAGIALNPGFDLNYSMMTLKKENNSEMDRYANMKWCLEAEMGSPFEWIFGVGIASLLAVEGARHLSNAGVIRKGWDNSKSTKQIDRSKEIKTLGKKALKSGTALAKTVTKSYLLNLPWHHRYQYYYGPRYYRPAGKAQFAIAGTYLNNDTLTSTTGQRKNWYGVTLATGWEETVIFGALLKYYDIKDASLGTGRGAGLDVGCIVRPTPKAALGLSVKEILFSDIQYSNGTNGRYPMTVNAGIALRPFHFITIAGDINDIFSQNTSEPTYNFGAEILLAKGLAIRGGSYNEQPTYGASLAIGDLSLDWALLTGTFNNAQMVGGTWRF